MDSLPKFTGLVSLNAGRIVLDHISFQFRISCFFPQIFAIKVGSCVRSCQILHVFRPQNFLGKRPKFLDLHYKIDADTGIDHVTKFRSDRPRELGDPMVN